MSIEEIIKELEHTIEYFEGCTDKFQRGRKCQAMVTLEQLRQYNVSGQSEQLVDFLLHLNDKELINNHDFDYEKEAKKYLKKIN